jgi:hypothetical protein
MADETTGIVTTEKMSILVRYVTAAGVKEAFVGFAEVANGQFYGIIYHWIQNNMQNSESNVGSMSEAAPDLD